MPLNWPFRIYDDSDERRNISRDRENQLSKQGTAQSKIWALIHVLANEYVEDSASFGAEVFSADKSDAKLSQDVPLTPRTRQIATLQQAIHDIERNPTRNSESSIDLATFLSTNSGPEEADGDILPPHPEAHQQESLKRTGAKPTLPAKAPKKKMSFDIFNRSKKPASELTNANPIIISRPVGPVKHTGYANAVGRATNFSIPRPAESLKNTASASNDPGRVEAPKAHSRDAEGAFSPSTTSAEAAGLEERIRQLQAAAKENNDRLERLRSETATTKNGDKSKPLSKSKSMFFNAKQAVVRKFGSSAEKEGKKGPKADNSTLPAATTTSHPDPHSRIDRRVAEGTNLGSPKVQYLTGEGRIKRKPLPAHQSTEWLPGTLEEDPFTDKTGMGGYLRSSYSRSSPQLDLSLQKNKQAEGSRPPPVPRFSPEVSGLAQHGEVGVFARAPVSASLIDSRCR